MQPETTEPTLLYMLSVIPRCLLVARILLSIRTVPLDMTVNGKACILAAAFLIVSVFRLDKSVHFLVNEICL